MTPLAPFSTLNMDGLSCAKSEGCVKLYLLSSEPISFRGQKLTAVHAQAAAHGNAVGSPPKPSIDTFCTSLRNQSIGVLPSPLTEKMSTKDELTTSPLASVCECSCDERSQE